MHENHAAFFLNSLIILKIQLYCLASAISLHQQYLLALQL